MYYPVVERIAHRGLRQGGNFAATPLVALFSTGDVVQDVCKSVLRSISGFKGESEGEFISYLVNAVKSRLVDLMRFHSAVRRDWRRRDQQVEGLPLIDRREGSPDDQLSRSEEVEAYIDVLARTPRRERELESRRIEDSDSFESLASRLGFPSADAARMAFYKARARLLVSLRDRGVHPDLIDDGRQERA